MSRLAGNFPLQAALFNDTQGDVNARLHFVKQMRDSVDLFQSSSEYAAFLQHLLPAYLAALLPPRNDVLEYIPPPRPADAPPPPTYAPDAVAYVPGSCGFHEHDRVFQIRQQILDTLVRLYTTSSSPIGPWIPKILKTMQHVLEEDNEDSGVLALKTIFELHRVFSHPHANPPRDMMVAPSTVPFAAISQQQLPGQPPPPPMPPASLPANSPMVLAPDSTAKQVQPFLDFVQRMYENVGTAVVKANFIDAFAPTAAAATGSAAAASAGGDEKLVLDTNVEQDPRARTFVRACEGLKVLHELPMVVTLLLQNYAPNTKESAKMSAQNVAQILATNASIAAAAAQGLPPPQVPPQVPQIDDSQLFILTVEHSNRIVDAMLRTLEQPFPQPPANILAEADPSLPPPTTPAAAAPAAAAASSSSSAMTDVVPAASAAAASSSSSSSSSAISSLAQSTPRISRDYAIRWKSAFGDFTLMQVKALNLLIYLLKDMTTAQCESLALNFLRLLANCPADALNSRKELLAAAANLFAGERNQDRTPSNRPTKFHHAIKPHLDRFFDCWDHGLLTGSMQLRLTHDIHQIRHIAYQCLNLLIIPLRPLLTFEQLRRVVYIFSLNVHDATLPIATQTAAISTLFNLVDNCFRLQETDVQGRTILVRILVTVVRKLETMRETIPQRLQALADKILRDREQLKAAETKAQQHLALMPTIVPPPGHELPPFTPFPLISHPKPVSVAHPEPGEVVRDLKHMLSVIMYGAKTNIWCITNYRQRPMNVPQGQPVQATERIPLTTGEVSEMGKLVDGGLACFRLFHASYTPAATPSNPDPAPVHFSGGTQQEKEVWWAAQKEYMENFASLFSVLEARVFRDVFTEKMETIFAHIVADAPKFTLIHVPGRFLSTDTLPPNEQRSSVAFKNNRVFAHILLTFLVKRMPEMCVASSESHVSAALVALFKLVFTSVHDNETILRPFIHPIVSAVLRLANQVPHPLNYFGLLRALFRSIGGGKFEQLYKEFLPLLPELLNGLMKFQAKAAPSGLVSSKGPQSIRDISIELCLTVPARLSSLLPYIPILMKAVLLALQASDEQVIKLGLRTLEFWVDNLNPDYLYPHMCPVLNELMRSLTALLRPLPSSFGATALSVLGKLGGRNRRFFIENYQLSYRAGQSGAQEDAWNIEGAWVDDAERVANVASATLSSASSTSGSVGSGLPVLNSFSLNLARPLEIARGILLKDYPIPFGLQLTQQQQSTPGPVLAYLSSHVPVEDLNSSTQGSQGMYQRLIQKYNAWLVVQQALLSMMDMKGDFAAFRSKLPRIESAAARKERQKREKAEEERERAEKEAADKEEAMMSEASYTGPDKSAAIATATVAPPAPPVLLSRPMGPPATGDAERLGVNSRPQHEHTRTQFKSLLQCLIIAAGDPYLRGFNTMHTAAPTPANGAPAVSEVASFLEGLVGHFAMIAARVPGSTASIVALKNSVLENGNGLSLQRQIHAVHAGDSPEAQSAAAAAAVAAAAEAAAAEAADFAVAPLFEAYHLDLVLFLDAILLCLAEENRYWSSAGFNTLRLFLASLITLLGPEAAAATPIVRDLLTRMCHSCHEDKWEVRHAAIMGLSLMVSVLPQEWLVENAAAMLRALLFTVRDEVSCFQDLSQTRATETLTKIVRDSVALAVERWERRRAGQDQADAAAAAAAESEEATAAASAAAMDTDAPVNAEAAAAPAGDGAAAAAGATEGDSSISALVRAESTAEQPTAADAAATDVDIHMADTEKTADAEEKKDGKEAAPAAAAATAAAPVAAAAAVAPSAESAVSSKNAFDDTKSPIIRMLINLLLPELVSSVAAVRECVHALFSQIADDLHKPVGEVLARSRYKMRDLCRCDKNTKVSALALAPRIGHISAATYAMSLSPPLLSLQDLRGMVQEVLQEQQEDQNYGNNHPSTRALKTALITKLRVESISLMSVTLSAPEMFRPSSDPRVFQQLKDLKENVIRIFFRSLMSRSPDVVRVAKKGLKSVIDREKLPKDLLQQCLRPVLLNLSDYRKLSVVLLEGLSRLLELLSNCFNVTLGETLLKHLQQFADPESLMKLRSEAAAAEKMAVASGNAMAIAQAQANRMKPEDEVKVAAAIIDLFHLLPPAPDQHAGGQSNSGKFLEYLVKYTLQLEAEVPIILHSSSPSQYPSVPTLPSPASTKADEIALKAAALDQPGSLTADATISSPYRGPLIKFLNVNPAKSVEFFLRTSLLNSKPRQLFLSVLRDPTAKPLRQHMAENPDLLVKWTFKYDDTFHWMSKNRFAADREALNAHAEKMAQHAKSAAEALATAQAAAAAAPAPSSDSAAMDTSSNTGTGTAAAPVVVDGAAPPAAAGPAGGSATPVAPAPAAIPTAADLQALSANAATASAAAAAAAAAAEKGPPPPPTEVDEAFHDRVVHGVHLTTIISSFYPHFLSTPTPATGAGKGATVLELLFASWDSPQRAERMSKEELHNSSRISFLDEPRWMAEATCNYIRVHPENVSVLWRLLTVFKTRTLTDFTFVVEFLRTQVTDKYTPEQRRGVIAEFVRWYTKDATTDPTATELVKARALKYLIIPLLRVPLAAFSESRAAKLATAASTKSAAASAATEASQAASSAAAAAAAPVLSPGGRKRAVKDVTAASTATSTAASAAAAASVSTSFLIEGVLDKDLLDALLSTVLGVQTDRVVHSYPSDPELRSERFRLVSLMMRYMSSDLEPYRSHMIDFLWVSIAREEGAWAKGWALIALCRLFENNDMSWHPKGETFITQVYASLMRQHQMDMTRILVRKATDILLPVLHLRASHPSPGHSSPFWLRWTVQHLQSEGHLVPPMVHLLSIIVRHADVYYPWRSRFLVLMMSWATKHGMSGTRGVSDPRPSLALELCETIMQWDRQCARELDAAKKEKEKEKDAAAKMEVDDGAAAKKARTDSAAAAASAAVADSAGPAPPAHLGDGPIRVHTQIVDTVISFLIRLCLSACENAEWKSVSRRTMRLLKIALETWPFMPGCASIEHRLGYVERHLTAVDKTRVETAQFSVYAMMLPMVHLLLVYSLQPFTPKSVMWLQDVLQKCARSTHISFREGVIAILTLLVKCHPPEGAALDPQRQPQLFQFYRNLREYAYNSLRTAIDPKSNLSINTQLCMIECVVKQTPAFLDVDMMHMLLKGATNLMKLALRPPAAYKNGMNLTQQQVILLQEEKNRHSLIYEALRIALVMMGPRIALLTGENRKNYLTIISHVIDRGSDVTTLIEVAKMLQPWVLSIVKEPTPAAGAGAASASGAAASSSSSSAPNDSIAPPAVGAGSADSAPESVMTPKERLNFVLKMCRFDRFESLELTHVLLDAVYPFFEAALSSPQRPVEMLQKMQRAFMLGVRCRDLQYRDKFIRMFHRHLGSSVADRMTVIFQVQDWDNLSDSFWIAQATDLLFTIVEDKLEAVPRHAHVMLPGSLNALESKVATDRVDSALEEGSYNQVTLPSFDERYWKTPDNLPRLAREESKRTLGLLRERLSKAAAGARSATAVSGGDSEMSDLSDARGRLVHRGGAGASSSKKRSADGAVKTELVTSPAAKAAHVSTGLGVATSPLSALLPALPDSFSIMSASGSTEDKLLASLVASANPEKTRASFLEAQSNWFFTHNSNALSRIIEPLRDLVHSSNEIAGAVWGMLLPTAWAHLTHDQRQELVNPISSLLAKEFHSRWPCDRDHLHPVQVLLESFAECHPTPAITPELLRFLAKTYNTWHPCMRMLEQRILFLGPEVPISANIPSYDALANLYRDLNEDDLWSGLWRRRVVSDYSHAALALEQFGMWPRAQDFLFSAISKKHSGGELAAQEIGPVGRSETIMWEGEWVRCSKHLNQWEVLRDFAHNIGHAELQWEAAWRLADWNALRDLCHKHAQSDIPNAKIYHLSLQIHDRKEFDARNLAAATEFSRLNPNQQPPPGPHPVIHEKDVERSLESAFQSSLREWQSYPAFVSNSHSPMLQRFQRLVELNESSAILTDMIALGRTNHQPNFKNFITTWKERLMNRWEELPVWSEILTWRCHMFNIILGSYSRPGAEGEQAYVGLHDLPWSMIKLAQVARKQQLPGVTLQILDKIKHFQNLDATDQFTRLREQIKVCLASPTELNASLNIICNTNVAYMSTEQRAELFRLKGESLQHLGYGDESNCFPIEDHEVMTDEGFLGYDAFRERIDRGQRVMVACPRVDGRLEWHAIGADRLIVNKGRHPLVAITQGDSGASKGTSATHIDLLVTRNHRMWVRLPSDKNFSIMRADSLLDAKTRDGSVADAQFLCNASQGVEGKDELRAMLRALRVSSGAEGTERAGVIFTQSMQQRDEVQRMAIMAGYTAHWSRRLGTDSEDAWAVSYSEQSSVSRPSLSCSTEVRAHKESREDQHRTVWCVSVPTAEQLIMVRRVTKRDDANRVVEASRPVVIGNTAFSACLSICDTYGKGWASWATFCDRVFTLKRDVQWADHALVCFIQAIANKFKRATLQMPRILSLLSFDRIENNGAGPDGPVLKAFGRFSDSIPLWVWIMWIPQLLTSLARFEGVYIRLILTKLGKLYPQALYYSMRAYLIDMRERIHHVEELEKQRAAARPQPVAPVAPVAAPASVPAADGAEVKTAKVEGGDAAMTDAVAPSTAASASASSSDAMPALDGSSSAAPAGTPAQAATTAASFASGTPAAIAANAPVPVPTPVQPLRDTPANQPPEGEAAAAAANPAVAPGAPAPAGGLPPPGQNGAAPAAAPDAGGDRNAKRERPEFLPNQAFRWVEDVCNYLRVAHPSLTIEVERMLEEMKWHFKPEPEEELLAAVNSNLARAYKQPPLPGDLISQEILARIKAIGDDYFRKHQNDPQYRKLIAFSHKYKAAWNRDFMPTIVHEPWAGGAHLALDCTMTEFLRRLRRWKSHLHWILGSSCLVQPLEKLSPYLSKFHSWDIEIPGQYIHDREPNPEQHHLIARFDKDVVTKLNGPFMRRLGMLSEEGKCVHFFVQQQNVHINRSDERMQQLYVLLNRLMRNYKETRKRHLVHHIATMIPIHSRWNLKETDPSQITLQDVYEEHCAVRGLDADAPLIAHRAGTRTWAQFQQTAVNVAPHTMAIEHNKHRLRIHEQICSTLVPDNILQRHMHNSITSMDQLFVFQGQFASQLALSGFLSYLLKVGDRTPTKITFSKSSGRVINTDFFLGYNELGIIENNEPVPFRLTRNLEMALSPTLIDGVVSSVMMTTNSCVLTHQEILKHFLSIMIRDDIHSAQTSMGRGLVDSDQKLRAMEQAARDKVNMNVGLVMKRITMLMSPATHTPTAAERAALAAGGQVPQANQPQPLNHKIHLLIKVATSKHKVSVMPPQWAPWF